MLDESINERLQRKDSIDITKEQWMTILKDPDLITEKDIKLLKLIFNCKNYEARSSQLAQLLNMSHHLPINGQIGRLGKRIAEKLDIQVPTRSPLTNDPMWWSVPFRGRNEGEGRFCYILKSELKEAMQEIYEKATSSEIISPEEIDAEIAENLYEGAVKQIYVNSYERSRDARDQCVKRYGARCVICGFDFEKTYGKIGRNVIHVHHLKPLSEIGEKHPVDYINDLRPVCPNCHVMIHKKTPPYSIDEVMAMIKNAGFE
jgi:5-methylcytosine-specific restriction protein A